MRSARHRHWSIWQPVREKEVKREAKRHKVKLLILPTCEAIEVLKKDPEDTNAILHVTC